MQKPEKKITFKHRVEYLVFSAFIFLVKAAPLFMVKFNRRLLRFIIAKAGKRHHGIVHKNLKIAFPDAGEKRILELKEAVYRHFSAIIAEIVYMFTKKGSATPTACTAWPLAHVKTFLSKFRPKNKLSESPDKKKPGEILEPVEVVNLHFLEDALKKGKGVIVFSAHFGNWELIPYILSRKLNVKINSIAREMDNPLVEKRVRQFREYMGSAVIYKKNAVRTMLNRLKNNGIVYLLIDQHAIRQEAVYVDFFGRSVRAIPTVSQLHTRKHIPVIPLFLHYEADKIVLELQEEIRMTGSGSRDEDIRRMTQLCTTMIEEKVKQYPEQWFWFHDRWKEGRAGGAKQPKNEMELNKQNKEKGE